MINDLIEVQLHCPCGGKFRIRVNQQVNNYMLKDREQLLFNAGCNEQVFSLES